MQAKELKRKALKRRKPKIDPEVVDKLQKRIKGACFGTTPEAFFAR